METLVENKIKKIYNSIMDKPNKILSIFNDFFGEDKVDMQGFVSFEEFKNKIYRTPIYEYLEDDDYTYIIDATLPMLSGENLNKALKQLLDNDNREKVLNKLMSEMSSGFILVHFPSVKITNEFNKSINIDHLYVKIYINYDGCTNGSFLMNRSEYDFIQFQNDYMHSHVSKIPKDNFTEFITPCLGKGPIADTIVFLSVKFDPDMWRLYCLELNKFVETESIEGVPYHKLESLIINKTISYEDNFQIINSLSNFNNDVILLIKSFVPHFIRQGKLKFSYFNGNYSIGMYYVKYLILISNEFIKWYVDKFNNGEFNYTFNKLKDWEVIKPCVILDNKIYYQNFIENQENYSNYIGSKVCTFKGKDVLVNITDFKKIDINISHVINHNLAMYVFTKIFQVINYKYKNLKENGRNGISEKIRYI